jgi:hypothetical protein
VAEQAFDALKDLAVIERTVEKQQRVASQQRAQAETDLRTAQALADGAGRGPSAWSVRSLVSSLEKEMGGYLVPPFDATTGVPSADEIAALGSEAGDGAQGQGPGAAADADADAG